MNGADLTSDNDAVDPAQEPSRLPNIQHRAAKGAAIYLLRTAAVRGVGALGIVLLARLLTPRQFGVYAITAFGIAFLDTLMDVGLAAALIQQRAEPDRSDQVSVFTVQLSASAVIAAIGWVVAEPLSRAYGLGDPGVWLVRALVLSLPLSSLGTIPAVLCERRLDYLRIGLADGADAVMFQTTAITLAALGAGVWSLVIATAVRGVGGVVVIQALAPWRPGIGLSRESSSRLLRFGLAYQAQNVLSFAKDSMTPTVVAITAGAAAAGYLNWAYMLATMPLLVSSSLWRVTFPAFSRANHSPEALRSMVEGAVRLAAIAFLPLSCLLVAAAPTLVHLFFGDKWLPALPAFYLFAVSVWTGPLLGSTFFSLFYATGHARSALNLTMLYGVLDWGIGLPLLHWLGYTGIAVRSIIVAYATLPVLIYAGRRVAPVRVVRQVLRAAAAAALAGLLEALLLAALPPTIVGLLVGTLVATTVYVATIAYLERPVLRPLLAGALPRGLRRPIRWYLLDAI